MAKAIFKQLVNGTMDVHHNGEYIYDVEFNALLTDMGTVYAKRLPKEEQVQELIDVAEEHGYLAELLDAGANDLIIKSRQACRPADIPGKLKGDKIKVSIIADEQAARERAKAFIPPEMPKPKVEKTPEQTIDDAIATLTAAGMSKDDIKARFGL